ncbi:hypothetical protein AX17_002186 [Amanita inopinata Kibby_2008]|nr:hypothetical protein AX17_002186 [Amanita inopinata Kibby_2008]
MLSFQGDPYDELITGLRHGQFYMDIFFFLTHELETESLSKRIAATLTVLVVDYIGTFDYEVAYMWPPKCNLVSILFFLTRYLPIVDMMVTIYTQHAPMTQSLCYTLARAYVWLIYVGMALAEGILTRRVWALYGNGRKLMVFLLFLYGGSFVAAAVKIQLSLATLRVIVVPLPNRPPVCVPTTYDQHLYLYWVFMIVVDAVSCILLFVKGARAYRSGGRTNLMRVVYRDGIMFYLVLLCFSVVNIIAIVRLSSDYSTLLTAPERVIHAVLAERVILHTRHQAYQDRKSATGIEIYSLPCMPAALSPLLPRPLLSPSSPSPPSFTQSPQSPQPLFYSPPCLSPSSSPSSPPSPPSSSYPTTWLPLSLSQFTSSRRGVPPPSGLTGGSDEAELRRQLESEKQKRRRLRKQRCHQYARQNVSEAWQHEGSRAQPRSCSMRYSPPSQSGSQSQSQGRGRSQSSRVSSVDRRKRDEEQWWEGEEREREREEDEEGESGCKVYAVRLGRGGEMT